MLAGQPDLVDHGSVVCGDGGDGEGRVVGDAEVAFRQDYDFGAGDVVFLEGFANDAL